MGSLMLPILWMRISVYHDYGCAAYRGMFYITFDASLFRIDGSYSEHSCENGYITLERNRRIDTNCVDSSVFLWKKLEKQEKNDSKKRPWQGKNTRHLLFLNVEKDPIT